MMLREFKIEADQNSLSESLPEFSASVKQNEDLLSWIDNLGSFPLR